MSSTAQSDTQFASMVDTVELFWVMTVQALDGRVGTRAAVFTAPVGFTREEAYDYVLAQFKEIYGDSLTVLFFNVAENEI